MRKIVNSKVININNIELFELAAEGLALQKTAVSVTDEGIEADINSPLLQRYIKQYDIFFKAMPYPLYAIEADIKYATLGTFIARLSKDKITMWVDRGLHILLDKETGMTLRIVNNTWSIIYETSHKENNTNIELYRDSVGYMEYRWILNKIINKETTANFYQEFMPDFIKACNGQNMIIKWELENMLTFGIVPNKTEFKQNKILDLNNNEEYLLDIFCTGTASTGEKIQSWNLSDNSFGGPSTRYKQIKTYGFDAYSKPMADGSKSNSKLEKCKITGLHNLFMQLCAIKEANDAPTFPNFEGVISDTNLVYTVDNRLYVAKSNRLTDSKDIAHGVELYTVENNKVYFVKSRRINEKSGIYKDNLYSYNIADGKIRLCKTVFRY